MTLVNFKSKAVIGNEYASTVERISELSESVKHTLSAYVEKILAFAKTKSEIESSPNWNDRKYSEYADLVNSGNRNLSVDFAYVNGTYLIGGKTETGRFSREELSAFIKMISLEFDFSKERHFDVSLFESMRTNSEEIVKIGHSFGENVENFESFLESLPNLFVKRLRDLDVRTVTAFSKINNG